MFRIFEIINLKQSDMKKWSPLLTFGILLCVACLAACDKDDDNPPDDSTPTPDLINTYSGGSLSGDVLLIDINQTQSAYIVHNETQSDSYGGPFTLMTGTMAGIYKLKAGADNYYGVELADQLLACSHKSVLGNSFNVAVGQELDNSTNLANITGDYIYLRIDDAEVNGSSTHMEWGLISVLGDSSFIVRTYATGGTGSLLQMSPENISIPLPLTAGDFTGSWQLNPSQKERLLISLSYAPGITQTGFAFANSNSSAFIVNLGEGNGFVFGLRISAATPAQLAGTYAFASMTNSLRSRADKITLNSTGTGYAYSVDDNGTETYQELDSLNQCSTLPNVVHGVYKTGLPLTSTGKIYCVLSGDLCLYVLLNKGTGTVISYGAGARK